MAALITHLVVGERVYPQVELLETSPCSYGAFLLGCVLPDVNALRELAREIEAGAGHALVRNFHPGSIATDESHASPAFWGNEATFKANADALKTAAAALAEELARRPTDEEGAVYSDHGRGDEPVSPDIWAKFNDVANACRACHATFRGPKW